MLTKYILILIGGFILMWIILASPLFSEDTEFSSVWEKETAGTIR